MSTYTPPLPPPATPALASKRAGSASNPSTPSTPSFWQKTKSGSKAGLDKVWGYADKLGDPVNRFSNKIGSEAFWPTGLEEESNKAARILRSFCSDGFYDDEKLKSPTNVGPTAKQRVLKKIPTKVIQNAKGLAIFTTMRMGLWFSGAGGSGILVARKEDGGWSPPCGIMLHTAGLGFLVGVDIYDCVLVLNTDKAVQAFSKWRCTLGGEVSAVAGPVGMGGIMDTEVHARQHPIFTYLKSRGFYASVQMDGTVIIERSDENERFYGQKLSVKDILAGNTQSRVMELEILMETLKAAQGDTQINQKLLPSDPSPSDYEVVEDGHVFGVPDSEDPDPFGLLALEKEGLILKEAGTKQDAKHDDFEFKPAVSSPVYQVFKKNFDSMSGSSARDSWRKSTSTVNTFTERPKYASQDMSTQTDFEFVPSPTKRTVVPAIKERDLLPSPPLGSAGVEVDHVERLPEHEMGYGNAGIQTNISARDEETEDEHDDAEEIHEVSQHVQQAPKFAVKPKMVAVAKRAPPPLPPRNPGRMPSGRNTPDDRSIVEPADEAPQTPSFEKTGHLEELVPEAETSNEHTHDASAATHEHVTADNDDHHDDDDEEDDDEYEEFDEAEEDIQVVTAVSASKVAQIRQVNPSMSSVTAEKKVVSNGIGNVDPHKVASTEVAAAVDASEKKSAEGESESNAHVNGTAHHTTVEEQSTTAKDGIASTATTTVETHTVPLAASEKDEPEKKAEELPGAFPDESSLAPAPAIPARSSARGSSKSPGVSPARSPARSSSNKPNHRVSMFGIRDSLHDEENDEEDEDEAEHGRTGRTMNGKHEADDFS